MTPIVAKEGDNVLAQLDAPLSDEAIGLVPIGDRLRGHAIFHLTGEIAGLWHPWINRDLDNQGQCELLPPKGSIIDGHVTVEHCL